MKKYIHKLSILVIISISPILFTAYFLSDDETAVAIVSKVVRDVNRRTDPESDWQLAAKGEQLFDGGEVKTGANSLALVMFTDGTGMLRVRENSIANIYSSRTREKFSNNTVIHKGTISFDINKQKETEEFSFTTPTMVASIRGTSGLIIVEEIAGSENSLGANDLTHRTLLIVEEGSIEVESTKGEKNRSTVVAGQALVSDDTGQLKTGEITKDQTKVLKANKATELKKVRFTVNGIEYEVEYYAED